MRFISKLIFVFILFFFIIHEGPEVKAESEKVFFKVAAEKAPIYKRVGDKLITIGSLHKNEVFPRVQSFGKWHEIQVGKSVGYIKKSDTTLIKAPKNYKTTKVVDIEIKTLKETVIYDNSTGKLIPFSTLNKGTTYQISRDYGNWFEVSISGRIGYISKKDVILQYTPSIKYFMPENDNIPIKVRIKDKLEIVGYLEKKQTYRRVQDYGSWHEIQFNGHVAYVHKNNTTPILLSKQKNGTTKMGSKSYLFTAKDNLTVYDNSTGKLIPFAEIKDGETYGINKDFGNWYEVVIANRLGYVKKNSVILQFTPSIDYFKVVNETNVYKQGKNGLIKIGTLEEDEEFPIVDDYGNWHKIQFNSGYGFVKKRDTLAILTSTIKNELKRKTTPIGSIHINKDTRVFDNTSGKLVSFMELSKGQSIEVLGYGKWLKINILNRVGYVLKNDVTFTSTLDTILEQSNIQSTQMLVVESSKSTSTKANLVLYEKHGDLWKKVLGTPAVLGKNGMSNNKKEGDGRTPTGLYPLRSGFGTKAKPSGVNYPYKSTKTNDYWVDDSTSSDYNKWKTYNGDPNKKWKSYEKLTNSLYRHALIIGYNDQPIVKGKGSAIFLHVWRKSSSPTLGCVAISEGKLIQVLQKLNEEKNPHILIGTKATIPTFYYE